MKKARGQYENEVEKPSIPAEGRMEHGMGCMDFKGEADPIAYGQAASEQCTNERLPLGLK